MEQLGKQNLENTMHDRVQAVIARTKGLNNEVRHSVAVKRGSSLTTQDCCSKLASTNMWPFSMRRTSQQNARMWALLADISRQLNWQGMHLSKSEWKDLFMDYMQQLHHVQLIKGRSTSHMSIEQMRQLIALIVHFGLMHGVEFNLSFIDKPVRQKR